MSIQSARQLVEEAQKSGLLTVAEAGALGDAFDTQRISTAPDAAAELVRNQTLTEFQIERLLAGRGEECMVAGRYRITQKLGEGAFGAVYRAVDTRLERTVAIKVLPPHSLDNPETIARFQREAKALAKLSHPNIIQAYDVGEDRGRHFVVMEFVEGKNLHAVIGERGPLPPARAADYICQAALGLQHAHEKGLVHRDLKPSNLLVTSDGQVKIVDLGLARFFQDQIRDPHLTREGIGMGTPDYMPPEQFRDARAADPRADIYSLGCTFYHLLTGEPPFPGTSISEKCRAHEEATPPLEKKCPEAPAGIIDVVLRMMAKRPEARYHTALDVAHALSQHVAGGSVSSIQIKATTSWQGSLSSLPTRVETRRQARWPLIAATCAMVLLAAGLGVPRLLDWMRDEGSLASGAKTPSPGSGEGSESAAGSAGASEQPGVNSGQSSTTADAVHDDPNLLTVSKDPKEGGQFRTINAAIDKARPGMTVRVVDDAVYSETISLSGRSRFANLTLESPRRATISAGTAQSAAIRIAAIPGLTIRGFRLQADAPKLSLVDIRGPCPGLLIEQVEMQQGTANDYDGFFIHDQPLGREDPPVVIQDCTLLGPQNGINVLGASLDFKDALPCARIIFRNNRITNARARAVLLVGCIQQVQVVGNRMEGGGGYSSIQLEHLKQAADVLIANNTVLEPTSSAFRLWDERVAGERIEVRNNLVLASPGADMVFIDSGGSMTDARGPGDIAELQEKWQLTHNWRETILPRGISVVDRSWIPPGSLNVLQERIEVLSRDALSENFLRPAADSKLASDGAGNEVADLPKYIGAMPPPGVEAWDWDATWHARSGEARRPAAKAP